MKFLTSLCFLALLSPLAAEPQVITPPKKESKEKKPRKHLESGHERKLDVVYKTIGERKLQLDIYYPAAEAKRPCPTIIYTHGGGWAAGSRFGAAGGGFAPLFKDLIKAGFCIVSTDYRLYSKESPIRMRDCVIDAKDALRYIVKNNEALGIDPENLFTFGDSAGGQIAQMLLLASPEALPGDPKLAEVDYEVKAGLSWYGPCDFEDVSLFNHDDREGFRDRFGARIIHKGDVGEKKLQLYREMSPINYLKKESPPLLMIQGDKDTTIPVKHAHYIDKKAKELGAPVEVLIVKNAGHNWRRVDADISPTRQEIIQASAQFFIDQLK